MKIFLQRYLSTSFKLIFILYFNMLSRKINSLGNYDVFSNSKKWIFLGDRNFSCHYFAKHVKAGLHSRALRWRNTFANSSSGILLLHYIRFRILSCETFNLEELRKYLVDFSFSSFLMCSNIMKYRIKLVEFSLNCLGIDLR